MRVPWWLWLAWGLCACAGEAKPAAPPAVSVSPVKTPAARAAQGSEDRVSAPPAPPATRAAKAKAPARGCAVGAERVFYPGAGRAFLAEARSGIELVLAPKDEARLEHWHGPEIDQLSRAHELRLAAPIAELSLIARGPKELLVAFVDSQGKLFTLGVNASGFETPKLLASGVDRRFEPALALSGALPLIAFTRTVDGAMHTFVARLNGTEPELVDVTPVSHGAAAGRFVRGLAEPVLVMIDARAGVSPLLEVTFDAKGHPEPAIVRTPVSQPYAPPKLVAVALPEGEVMVAYSVIGRAAATAIGRVPLRRAEQPVPLEPSKGYGELSFSAAPSERSAVFALEVPKLPSNDPARVIAIKRLDASGEGIRLELVGDGQSAFAPSLAARGKGQFLLSYSSPSDVRIAELSCDP